MKLWNFEEHFFQKIQTTFLNFINKKKKISTSFEIVSKIWYSRWNDLDFCALFDHNFPTALSYFDKCGSDQIMFLYLIVQAPPTTGKKKKKPSVV